MSDPKKEEEMVFPDIEEIFEDDDTDPDKPPRSYVGFIITAVVILVLIYIFFA